MQVRVIHDGLGGEEQYEVRGLTRGQAERLAALADFPLWADQPEPIADLCAELFDRLTQVLGLDRPVGAADQEMVPSTTVDD